MSEKNYITSANNSNANNSCCDKEIKETVCIHTDKVFDSCRDKDCLENVRVYLTAAGQSVVDRAINVKCIKAEIIWVFSDVNRSKYNFLCKNKYASWMFRSATHPFQLLNMQDTTRPPKILCKSE